MLEGLGNQTHPFQGSEFLPAHSSSNSLLQFEHNVEKLKLVKQSIRTQ